MSKLEKYLANQLYATFPYLGIRQNYRPDWLTSTTGQRLELDFYIESMNLAAEIQGEQHYKFVEYFHRTLDNFNAQKKRDEDKKIQCRANEVRLVEVFTEKDADLFVALVTEGLGKTYRDKLAKERDAEVEEYGLSFYDHLPELRKAIKLARRAILRSNGINVENERKNINKKVGRVFLLAKATRNDVFIEEVVDWYRNHKKEIDLVLEDKKCDLCKKEFPKRKPALYSAAGLVDHLKDLHGVNCSVDSVLLRNGDTDKR